MACDEGNLTPALKDGGRSSSAMSRSLLSRGLVVLQVALSLVLLVGAGLFVRTLLNLQRVEPGFNMNNLLLFGLPGPGLIGYKDEKVEQLFRICPSALKLCRACRRLLSQASPCWRGFRVRAAYICVAH